MSAGFAGLPRIDLRPQGVGGSPCVESRATWRLRCSRSAGLDGPADDAARTILADVRARGDAAIFDYVERFEGRTITAASLEVSTQRRLSAASKVSEEVREAIQLAARRVHLFHRTQKFPTTGVEKEGWSLHSRAAPLSRVAVYAPGGTAAYPSSVLMAGIPAKVAGVREVFLLTPRASDVVLYAASVAGIDRVFEVGGAQAIAAAAF
ncbi:MAG: histidinol dehydrogenase, partial [Nannocystaceae bacterium]|nr:histidinol dehydrogenase [Nannocystaceae bacterium]